MKQKIIGVTLSTVVIYSVLLLTLMGSCREAETVTERESGTSSIDTGVTSPMETGDTALDLEEEINEESAAGEYQSPPVVHDESAVTEKEMPDNEVIETMKENNLPPIDTNRPSVTETATFALG